MKLTYALLSFLLLASFGAVAQENQPDGPFYVGEITRTYVPPINQRLSEIPDWVDNNEEKQDGRASRIKVVPGKDPQTENDYFSRNKHPLTSRIPGQPPILVFDAAVSSSQPTDPSLAVGPDHVLVVFNTGFIVYDKNGVAQSGQMPPNPSIFPSGGCCDLTVSYDQAAERWVLSFLGGGAQVAISDGTSTDPLATGWNVYNIPQINDYQKLSQWSDGYYITDNTGSSNKVWAMDRAAMIAGDPAASIQGFDLPGIATSGFYSPQAFNVTDDNLPAAGGLPVVYLQDDAWGGVTTDHVKLWTIDADFTDPTNSTVSAATELPTTPFISVFDGGSFSNLTQPGGGIAIDALQATIMNQAQFRKFGSHNSAIFNFVIDVDASSGEKAAVRWYELRQSGDGMPWSVFQEGTYEAPDTPTGGEKHAWHASMMMDVQGNIGMGYSSMTVDPGDPNPIQVSSYYTGRFSADPAGTMTIAEELIRNGDANIPGLRYGDYSKIDIDPADDKTFWFINEYMSPEPGTSRADVVGVFKIAPDFNVDVGAVSIDAPNDGALTATEQVDVTIFNFGQLDQSNIDLELYLDGNLIATEVFAGPLVATTSAPYTFTATLDLSTEGQTYEIEVRTNLGGDEDTNNDGVTKMVTHVLANDIGAIEITAPSTGEGLGNEDVTITIENFGTAEQTNFDVSYSVDGGTPVVETVAGPLASGATISYTFAQQADLSTPGASYIIEASSELGSDGDASNNSVTKGVTHLVCSSLTNDTDQPVGPDAGTTTISTITITDDFTINDVNVNLNIDHTWVGDLDIQLIHPDNTTSVTIIDRVCGNCQNFTDTTLDDEATDPIAGGTPPFTGSFQPSEPLSAFDGLSSIGDWTLVITDNANQDGGTLLDWSLNLCEGQTAGVGEEFANNGELVVLDQGNDQYKVLLPTTTVTERLEFSVLNMRGQILASYRLDNEDGTGYEYDLDMSYVPAGVYIVRIGDKNFGGVKRIIVR
ncbi:MAG: hypothetical protein Aureis2KO_02230 [Aureisphaera sp.]